MRTIGAKRRFGGVHRQSDSLKCCQLNCQARLQLPPANGVSSRRSAGAVKAAVVSDRPRLEEEQLIAKRAQRNRVVVVAVDNTQGCVSGLSWLAQDVLRAGAPPRPRSTFLCCCWGRRG